MVLSRVHGYNWQLRLSPLSQAAEVPEIPMLQPSDWSRSVSAATFFAVVICTIVFAQVKEVPAQAQEEQQAAKAAPADESESPPAKEPAAKQPREDGPTIQISSVKIGTTSNYQNFVGSLSLEVVVRNKSKATVSITEEELKLEVDGKTTARLSISGDLKSRPQLQPGEERKARISVSAVSGTGHDEPDLELQLKSGPLTAVADVNLAFRAARKYKTELMGPNDSLAVVSYKGPMDYMFMWTFEDELKRLQQLKMERVVLDADTDRNINYPFRMVIGQWLGSISQAKSTQRFPLPTKVESKVKFMQFFAVGLPSGTIQYNVQSTAVVRPNRERAIADALKSAYSNITLEVALADLKHKEAGVRRSAIESNIDRMSLEQLDYYLAQAEKDSPEHLRLLAENLYRVPYTSVTDRMLTLTAYKDEKVAQAATEALVRCISPSTVRLVTELWNEDPTDKRHQMIVTAVLTANDHRYLPLMSRYAIGIVESFGTADDDAGEPEDGKAEPGEKPPTEAVQIQRLRKVFGYLARYQDQGYADAARRMLMKIPSHLAQDEVMTHLQRSLVDSDGKLARRWIESRLPAPDTSGMTPQQKEEVERRFASNPAQAKISDVLLGIVRKYPDKSYTAPLLRIAAGSSTSTKTKSGGQISRILNNVFGAKPEPVPKVSSSLAQNSFRAAMLCADHEQLNQIIDDYEKWNQSQQRYLIQQVVQIQHPEWVRLVRLAIKQSQTTSVALSALQANPSVEGYELIADIMREERESSEKRGRRSSALFNILNQLRYVTYPAVRRELNLCVKSKLQDVATTAEQIRTYNRRNMFQNHPMSEQLTKATESRSAGKIEDAIAAYSTILERDPFLDSLLVSRGSLYMRANQPELGLKDLERANTLNPEDCITQSIHAIAMIRNRQIAKGIRYAEEIMESVPDRPSPLRTDTIYNTACVYGRAIEIEPDAEKQKEYMTRGILLLRKSIERQQGFHDPQHLLDDPDLNSFHDHEHWNELLEKVRENEKKTPRP